MEESLVLALLSREQKTSVRIARNFFARKRTELTDLGLPFEVMLRQLQFYGLRGGKWHRPTLTRLAVRLMNQKITPEICRASVALELVHRFLLIHDDIVDQDLERHGGPTMQKFYQDRFQLKFTPLTDQTYSAGMAIVAGDVLHTFAFQFVAECGIKPELALAVIGGINQLMVETAAGWALETDLKMMSLNKSTLKQVMLAMRLVSANYSVLWPLRIGQILAGQPAGAFDKNLEIYGTNVGIAFQIQDDILAIFGDQNKMGKPVGNDLREGKKTLLVQYAYEQANKTNKKILQKMLNTNIDLNLLEQVREIIIKTGALTFAKETAQAKANEGIRALKRVTTNAPEAKDQLIALAEFMVNRNV